MKRAPLFGTLGLLAGIGLLVACGGSGGSSPSPVQGGIDSCIGEYAGQIPADFSASGYAAANPDLAAAICIDGACDGADECRDLVRHWANYGQSEGRTYDAPVVPSSAGGSSEGGSSEGGNSAGTPSSSSITTSRPTEAAKSRIIFGGRGFTMPSLSTGTVSPKTSFVYW